ncbi:hypothetical protein [Allomeiothermus silvanus]|uniref:hypothetical protein n=1 Tax=Allomeiothermus silvanus TaxID=52022 RepID=UPI00019E9C6E|nr:hypothetical protein [Allomeiothermus silvanus]
MFPNTLTSDQIEGWLARGLTAELKPDIVKTSLLAPRPVRLPVYEGEQHRGVLEGWTSLEENALVIEGVFQEEAGGVAVRVAVSWEEIARRFDLADTPLYLWRARRLPAGAWEAWRADLDRLGLVDRAVLLGTYPVALPACGQTRLVALPEGQTRLEGGPLCRAEPTQENAWAFWLAAWRFGSRVALDLGMRRASLERAFTALKERLPELPDVLLERSREAEGWGKEELRALRE